MGRIGAFRIRRGVLLGLIGVLALTLAACFRPPRPQPPVAAFSVSTAPMVASFTETSTGTITSRSWDFGDGGTSTEANPTHDYANHGNYTVTLTVTGPGGSDTETQTVTIMPPAPVASFAVEPSSGTIPLTVTMTNTSTGLVDAIAWDLDGDGVFDDATGQTATRTFDNAGSHTIGLSVTGPGGTSTTTQTVVANLPPAVSITAPANGASVIGGTTLSFTGIANDAEDGNISSTIAWTSSADGPLGTGASIQVGNLSTGAHMITASVTDSAGVPATSSINITVTVPPPAFQVVLNASPTAGLAPLAVNFNACQSTGTNLRFRWDFDNDGVDDQVNPCSVQHTYTTPHLYTAKLTVEESVPGGGQATMTKQILVSSPPDPGDPGDCGGRRCEEPPPTDDPGGPGGGRL